MALEWTSSSNDGIVERNEHEWDQWLTFEGIEDGRVYRLKQRQNPARQERNVHKAGSLSQNASRKSGIPSRAQFKHRRSRSNGQLCQRNNHEQISAKRSESQSFDDEKLKK